MAIAYDRQDLAEELLDVFSSLPRGLNDDDIRFVRRLAAEESAADHWLQTAHLDKETRLSLMAAVAYVLRCLKNDPYKCAVFTRAAAEAVLAEKKSAA
ncbi:hypothetical protein [uncultured Desulfovibrio sp.]|uniref:hypothetical protein n=1 Tax=uncultured Desulfovibrio sp. TaxID=167968 RepID=UPI00260236C8|nr:hypothetical protein [uncultured Desulfovibrio sp.]